MFDGPSIVQQDSEKSNMANYIEHLSSSVGTAIYKLLTGEDQEIEPDAELVEALNQLSFQRKTLVMSHIQYFTVHI